MCIRDRLLQGLVSGHPNRGVFVELGVVKGVQVHRIPLEINAFAGP